jgi:photosystem II stability/assembly factor-like uncharacterized protein
MKPALLLSIFTLALICKTNAQWQALNTHVNGPVSSICFLNTDTGFACADSNFLKTTDGGLHWMVINPLPEPYNLYKEIYFTDSQTGYLNHSYYFAKTNDGGQHWHWMNNINGSNPNIEAVAMYFFDNFHGIALAAKGNPFQLQSTADSGYNWNLVHLSSYPATDLFFASPTEGFMTCDGLGVMRLADSGRSGLSSQIGGDNYSSVYFTSSSTGYVIAPSNGIYKSIDSGKTWRLTNPDIINGLNRVAFVNADTGFAVGYAGAIYLTTDSGAHWVKQNSHTTVNLTTIFITPDKQVFVGGDNGTILKTTNLGIETSIAPEVQISPQVTIYPNPSSAFIHLEYTIPAKENVNVWLYDIAGRKLTEIVQMNTVLAGTYSVQFDSEKLKPGIYFFRLQAGNQTVTEKFIKT